MEPLKYLSNFWRTLEIPLINCEINIFFLDWSEKSIIVTRDYGAKVNNQPKFEITDAKRFIPVVICQLKIMKNYCAN